jgi:amidohydrolase
MGDSTQRKESKMTTTSADAKSTAYGEIDRQGDEAVRMAKDIRAHPETGYREHRTAGIVTSVFRRLGIPFEEGLAITGVKGILDTGRPGPTVAVMGELDSHLVRGHPHADPATDFAHACGHHAQVGMLLALAMGLKAPGVMDGLSGRIALIAIPAEEYIEIEYRNELRLQGKIEFLVGKSEWIKLGLFDDVDMALITHTDAQVPNVKFRVGGTANGMVAKQAYFKGVSASAGSLPHLGVNALNAAMLALGAIHAQRETFRDEDAVRVHPIITRGGGAVSAVPDDVRLETHIRAKTIEGVLSATKKVDRALKSGAFAMGASVTITTTPGYLPVQNDPGLQRINTANLMQLAGEDAVTERGHAGWCSDTGDLATMIPVAFPMVASSSGSPHGRDYLVEDYPLTIVSMAKGMAGTVIDLLSDGAEQASQVKESFKPTFTREQYLKTVRGLAGEETYPA